MPPQPTSPISEYWTKSFGNRLEKMELRTSGSVKAELLGSIDLYSEVKIYGKELLRSKGHTNPARSFKSFQAYIRQGKTFYQAGDALYHRASPLLYYYAFMNFGKAMALLKDPQFVDNGLVHGLEHKFQPGRLKRQFLRAKQHGVFPAFYSAVTGKTLQPSAKLKILDLFGYDSDVGYEYSALKFGQARSLPVKFVVARFEPAKSAHALLAIARSHALKSFGEINKRALKGFTEVTVPIMKAREIFDIPPEEQSGYAFFESTKKQPTLAPNWFSLVVADAISSLGDWLSLNPVADPFLFRLDAPIRTPNVSIMNEFMAIYCLTYYLGSLVRYRPQYLESLLATKDAWVIERFLSQAPITFLRHFRNAIDDRYIAMCST